MRRSTRKWVHWGLPLLATGLVALMLVPADQSSTAGAKKFGSGGEARAAVISPPTRAQPAIMPVSVKSEITARPADDSKLVPEVTKAAGDARPASAQPQVVASVSPQWSDYARPGSLPTGSAEAATSNAANFPDGRIGQIAVNARSGPSASSGKLFVLAAGEPIKVGETNAGWIHVYRQTGESGWVYGRYVAGQAAPPVAGQEPRRAVADNSTRPPKRDMTGRVAQARGPIPVRAAPIGRAPLIFVLEPGESVRIAETRGAWARVVTSDGISGWIPT